MDFQFYKNFIVIVESGSLTTASKLLHVAQPALSNQLKTLETEYDARLLVRGSRHVSLTDAGKILYGKAKSLQELEKAARREISEYSMGISGTLQVALTFSNSFSLVQKFFSEFHEKYPEVKFELFEGDTRKVLELLNSGLCEVGIARGPLCLPSSIDVLYDIHEPMYIVFRCNSGYLEGFNSVEMNDLSNIPLCISERFKLLFTKACESAGIIPDIFCVSTQLISNILWAKTGMCAAIVPYSIYQSNTDENLVGLEIKSDLLASSTCLLAKKDCSALSKRFCDYFLEYKKLEPTNAK